MESKLVLELLAPVFHFSSTETRLALEVLGSPLFVTFHFSSTEIKLVLEALGPVFSVFHFSSSRMSSTDKGGGDMAPKLIRDKLDLKAILFFLSSSLSSSSPVTFFLMTWKTGGRKRVKMLSRMVERRVMQRMV